MPDDATSAPQPVQGPPRRNPEEHGDDDPYQVTIFAAVGGQPFFDRLTDRFYDRVEADEVLVSMYPNREDLGPAPAGERFIVPITGGWFRGGPGHAGLAGKVLPGGADFQMLVSERSARLEARYVLEGRLAEAPLGSTISIQLTSGRATSTLQVPLGAIFDPGKGPGVWLVDKNTGQVTWRAVQVASLGSETAAVANGLAAGDRIVVLGAQLLHEGEKVRQADGEGASSVAAEGKPQ